MPDYAMVITLTLDDAGRIALPQPVRDLMHLRAGSKVRLDVNEDEMVIKPQVVEVQVVVKKDGLPAVIGWEGFDAVQAVQEMREEQVARLEAPFCK